MGGLQRFERRWSWWIRMRESMRLKAYDRECNQSLKRAAWRFIISAVTVLVIVALAIGTALCMAPTANAQGIPEDAQRYRLTLTREARQVWGLKAPISSFAGQIHQESRWNPDARSPVGAQGLAQFMPSTSAWIGGLYPSLADRAPTNPTWAIRALVTYDADLFVKVKRAADDCHRFAFALSAYNGGLGWVNKRQALSADPDRCFDAACSINPGITPASQRENESYPRQILLRNQNIYALWGPGICP